MTRPTKAERASEIYDVIQRFNRWCTRSDIAEGLGRERLNPLDIEALQYLVTTAKVIAEQHKIESPIPVRWEYKISNDWFDAND